MSWFTVVLDVQRRILRCAEYADHQYPVLLALEVDGMAPVFVAQQARLDVGIVATERRILAKHVQPVKQAKHIPVGDAFALCLDRVFDQAS